MKKFLNLLKNKYVIVAIFMITWIGFFDRYNPFKRWDDEMELHRLKQEKEYYVKQISEIKKRSDELVRNPESKERFARERYFMKKAGEVVYMVEPEKQMPK